MCKPPPQAQLASVLQGKEAVKCANHRIAISRKKRDVADPNRKCWSIMDNAGIESAYFPYATAHRFEFCFLELSLFRNKMIMLDEMTYRNASKLALFLEYETPSMLLYFFP